MRNFNRNLFENNYSIFIQPIVLSHSERIPEVTRTVGRSVTRRMSFRVTLNVQVQRGEFFPYLQFHSKQRSGKVRKNVEVREVKGERTCTERPGRWDSKIEQIYDLKEVERPTHWKDDPSEGTGRRTEGSNPLNIGGCISTCSGW